MVIYVHGWRVDEHKSTQGQTTGSDGEKKLPEIIQLPILLHT